MRKMRLEVESLEVESFLAEGKVVQEGTVHAQEATVPCPMQTLAVSMCARQGSYYETCVVDCECTNRIVRCIDHTQ
jgi:hypothetical protein